MGNIEDYTITHLGNGKFQVDMDGEIKEAGPSLCGMIRYTYFEDYSLPEIGWKTTRILLFNEYVPKMRNDVLSGKLKPGQLNY